MKGKKEKPDPIITEITAKDKRGICLSIPEDLYVALVWYLQKTSYWISYNFEHESLNDLIIDLFKAYLRGEYDYPRDAIQSLKEEMNHRICTL